DLFDLDDFLMPPGFARALLLLVLILAVVHDAADGRDGRRRDFHQVEPLLLGDGERLRRRHDAELLPGIVDDANLANTDAFVHPYPIITSRSSVESDNYLLGLQTR